MRKLSVIIIIIAAGCIEPINLALDGGGTIVVEGIITDEAVPYSVKISRSIDYDNSRPLRVYSIPERGARVSILDGEGYEEVLTEPIAGEYRTNNIRGKVGGRYQLIVQTTDGKKYRSTFETILPVPKIKSIQPEYVITETLFTNSNGDARVNKQEGFDMYITLDDPVESTNYYRWQATGIFEFFSVGDLPANLLQCWAPVGRLESKIEVESDTDINGQQLRRYIANVIYDRTFRYKVTVRQYSLSAGAYEFWRKLGSQQTSTGTLFDPPPTAVTGNVVNEENSKDIALGYFGASSVYQSYVVFDRFLASGRVSPARNKPPRAGICLGHEPNATNVRPEGF